MFRLWFIVLLVGLGITVLPSGLSSANSSDPTSYPSCFNSLGSGEKVRVRQARDGDILLLSDDRQIILADLVYQTDQHTPNQIAALVEQDVLFFEQGKDRYGRFWGQIHVPQVVELPHLSGWLQARLVESGAYLVMPSKGSACGLELAGIQRQSFPEGSSHWPALKADNTQFLKVRSGYHRVDTSVVSIGVRKRQVYINTSRDWSTDFTVIVDRAVYDDLEPSMRQSLERPGTKLRVSGWVSRWNGPVIRVTHAAQLELLNETVSE